MPIGVITSRTPNSHATEETPGKTPAIALSTAHRRLPHNRLEVVVLHELAHLLNERDDGHGTGFAHEMMYLVRNVLGNEAAVALDEGYRLKKAQR